MCGPCTGAWDPSSRRWRWNTCTCGARVSMCCFCGDPHVFDDDASAKSAPDTSSGAGALHPAAPADDDADDAEADAGAAAASEAEFPDATRLDLVSPRVDRHGDGDAAASAFALASRNAAADAVPASAEGAADLVAPLGPPTAIEEWEACTCDVIYERISVSVVCGGGVREPSPHALPALSCMQVLVHPLVVGGYDTVSLAQALASTTSAAAGDDYRALPMRAVSPAPAVTPDNARVSARALRSASPLSPRSPSPPPLSPAAVLMLNDAPAAAAAAAEPGRPSSPPLLGDGGGAPASVTAFPAVPALPLPAASGGGGGGPGHSARSLRSAAGAAGQQLRVGVGIVCAPDGCSVIAVVTEAYEQRTRYEAAQVGGGGWGGGVGGLSALRVIITAARPLARRLPRSSQRPADPSIRRSSATAAPCRPRPRRETARRAPPR